MYRYKRDGTVVLVKELPSSVQRSLKDVGYGAKDIDVIPAEKTTLQGFAGRGTQAFAIIINMVNGQSSISWGSWGGQNAYEKKGVDWDNKYYKIPETGAVITGSRGGGRRVYAKLYVNPKTMAPLLPKKSGTSEREKDILDHFVSLKPAYRKEYMERMKPPVSPNELDSLVTKGFLKRNKAGATMITLTGKNALREDVSFRNRKYIREARTMNTLRQRGYLSEAKIKNVKVGNKKYDYSKVNSFVKKLKDRLDKKYPLVAKNTQWQMYSWPSA